MIEKIRNFHLPSPSLSVKVDWRVSEMINSSGYSVMFVLFTLSGLKVKVGGFRVKFVEVYV